MENGKTIDITPNPRVLKILGEIELLPWRCIAELIDNSIDSFFDQGNLINADPRVTITLPTQQQLRDKKGVIQVIDNGSGMTVQQLNDSVRAGYSGNDPVNKLGLFGMGFNIATARLANRTEIWTTTADSAIWTGVQIDFQELDKQYRNATTRDEQYRAPIFTQQKSITEIENKHHGTIVKLSNLNADRIFPLIIGTGRASTVNRLSKSYGSLIREKGVQIFYGPTPLFGWRHCIWDESRSVSDAQKGEIKAVRYINESLPHRLFCGVCWAWLTNNETVCPVCLSSDNLIKRQRTLKGWIGIQRYFDEIHYGIDLIRNGRVIEEYYKGFFYYFDRVLEEDRIEYPRDGFLTWGGRIVGELEIDFVRVGFQKNSFDRTDPEWLEVERVFRGGKEIPMQPRIAQRMGLPPNNSPLADMFSAFRQTSPAGLKTLVMGDEQGKAINTGRVVDMIRAFDNGDEEYQSDELWFKLVIQAENAKKGPRVIDGTGDVPPPAGEDDDTRGMDDDAGDGSDSGVIDDYQVSFEDDLLLSGDYKLDFLPYQPTVHVRALRGSIGQDPYKVEHKPGPLLEFTYNPEHEYFTETLDDPTSFLIKDMAYHIVVTNSITLNTMPLAVVEKNIRDSFFPDKTSDIKIISDKASMTLKELRNHYEQELVVVSPIDVDSLGTRIIDQVRQRIFSDTHGDEADATKVLGNGSFVLYLDNYNLLSIFEKYPELCMDHKFFENPYESVSRDLQETSVTNVLNGLRDILWLSEEAKGSTYKDAEWKLRYGKSIASMLLLENWRSSP